MNSNPLVDLKLIDSFIFVLVMFSLQVACQVPNAKMGDCEPKTCVNITFLFWIEGHQPHYCGIPNFRLACKQSSPVLSISSEDFYIHNISYVNTTLLLSKAPKLGSSCAYPFQVPSLDRTPFRISPANKKLFFLNCTEEMAPPSNYSEIICGGGGGDGRFLYIGDHQLPKNVSDHCGPPVEFSSALDSEFGRRVPEDFLRYGFLVNYSALGCERCIDSGGRCGFYNHSLLCICSDRVHSVECSKGGSKLNVKRKILIAVGGVCVGVVIMLMALWIWVSRRRKLNKGRTSSLTSLFRSASTDPSSLGKDPESISKSYYTYQTPIFSYEELEEATGGFDASKELGDGGFGVVYKGKLRDGRVVAVKRLYEKNYRRVQQFRNEVEILNRLHHPNLVSLYGCTSSRELLLVYEFVPNGTVADHLHGSRSGERALTWTVRMNIAIETAEALAYLHAVDPQIVHRDVKTTNILLDSNYRVKVADFGLSRLFPLDVTHVSTAPQGTPGYVDPEYHQCYQLTDKSDVYSFGVVLAELISSKAAVDITRNRNEINLSNMALSKIPEGLVHEMVDPALGFGSDSEVRRMVESVAELAFRCLQLEKDMRPAMDEVREILKLIASGGDRTTVISEKRMRDDARLLSSPASPNSVVGAKWLSSSTTPNTSA